ncbi:band 4.1-like protein 2 isoform X3 [Sphaerodactylus townsendi]|uniref:band 4.1-like protein 2 isoform X3 n=1 Tax=Sphaerodactylus townsendi TaxID=933632 RepID=UPI002025C56B|nr:band 4.1-like protein 2 isoform X3 [Sphaerodactylus townsendi]
MTTEGSETKVKASEKLETHAAKENAGDAPESQKEQGSEIPEGSPVPEIPPSENSPKSSKKEKDPSESKGISRFIPPWLKKQKTYSLTESKDGDKKKHLAVAEESECPLPGEAAQPKEKLEDLSEKQQEAKAGGKEEEEHSKIQLAKEDSNDIISEEKEDKQGTEESKMETKEVQTAEVEIERAVQKTPKKIRTVQCKVVLLDGTEYSCELEKKAKGQVLFDKVCEHLNLLEKDYFGLLFQDHSDQKNWIDPLKEIKRQIRNLPWLFTFNVKFYPPDPSLLTEDITRYFLCLQLRQDIASGRLPCSFVTHALLGSYTLQAELGDYDTAEHNSDYIGEFQFAPNQTKEMEEKVVELHKTHRDLTPAQADTQFLENAKRLSMYGVDLHHAKDSEGVDIMLGVCANGLLIYKDRLRINRFAWPKILKISYKRSNFYIKVRPTELEQFESTIGFKLPNHRAAKRLWKVCVEHHTFYRLLSPEQPPKAKFLTLGSKFRYSGRTQSQTRQASNLIDRPAPYFERTSSKRVSRSLDGAPVGITDQSLLKDFFGDRSFEAAGQFKLKDGGRDEDGGMAKWAQFEDGKSLEEEIASILFSKGSFSTSMKTAFTSATSWTAEGTVVKDNVPSEKPSASPSSQLPPEKFVPKTEGLLTGTNRTTKSSHETLNVVEKKQAEVGIEETLVTDDIQRGKIQLISDGVESQKTEHLSKKDSSSLSSDSSSNESEGEVEYQPHHRMIQEVIKEELEENEDIKEEEHKAQAVDFTEISQEVSQVKAKIEHPEAAEALIQINDVPKKTSGERNLIKLNEHGPKEDKEKEQVKLNGEASHIDIDVSSQIICCSEPPVVKTEMVTISDASQRTEISTKEVPIVQTETKTITYESPQLDGGSDAGVLLSAQTITAESVSTTTTTHITKTVKGGVSETRIEKRIVITGDADLDHDQALAQAIKEVKEQHPDMSVTRVVVHKETEMAEEGD